MRVRTLKLVTAGIQREGTRVTLNHLQQAVDQFNPDARPPVTLGHPTDSQVLAFGRVDRPRIEQDALLVDIHYTPVLQRLEDDGYVAGFSVGLYPHQADQRYYIHHVAALGELPPAADVQSLSVTELDSVTLSAAGSGLITLAADFIQDEIMDQKMKEAIALAVKEAMAAQLKPITEQQTKLAEQVKTLAAQQPAPAKSEPPQKQQKPTAQPQDPAQAAQLADMQKQLAASMDTIRADRINSVIAAAKAKGLSEDQLKPLQALLAKSDALALADNAADGVFAQAQAFIQACPEPAAQPGFLQPLALADDQPDDKINIVALAAKF